jgi:hypothetical protein
LLTTGFNDCVHNNLDYYCVFRATFCEGADYT